MADVYIKKMSNSSPRSPRIRAHPLKMMKAQTMKNGISKKAFSKKKIRSQYFYADDLQDDLMNSVMDDPDEIDTYRSINDGNGSIQSNYSMQRSVGQLMKSMVGEDLSKLQSRLTRALEDSDMLRSRLRMELQEKQALEMKVTELTDKLVEAKKGLQETSLALHKVQMATNQLMSKRDQRELQLQAAIDQNHLYEKKISELEMHISHMSEINEAKSGAHSHSEKLINEQLEKVHQLEEETGLLKGQISSLRRENMRLADEKADLEYMLETKKKRIGLLEDHIKSSENHELLPTPNREAMVAASRLNTATGSLRQSTSLTTSSMEIDMEELQKKMSDISNMGNKLDKVVGDKKFLEDRLQQLEENLLNQQTIHQKQLQQQQAFYQQQLQQIQLQSFSSNIPLNGISLPLDQIQQLAGANGGNGPIVIRAVSRGSSERPRSQQRNGSLDFGGSPNSSSVNAPSASAPAANVPVANAAGNAPASDNPRSRARGTVIRTEQSAPQPSVQFAAPVAQQAPAPTSTQNLSSQNPTTQSLPADNLARPKSNGRPAVEIPNAPTVSIPVNFGSAERQRSRQGPPPQSASSNSGLNDTTTGNTQKPSTAEEKSQRSAAEINAEGASSRQPSRQQQLMSRVSSATGANPEEVRKKLMDERKETKRAILIWNKKFKEENNREPTKAEREQSVGNHYRRYRQTTRILKELEGGTDNGESTKDKDDL